MTLMSQIFKGIANGNARYKRNKLELYFLYPSHANKFKKSITQRE